MDLFSQDSILVRTVRLAQHLSAPREVPVQGLSLPLQGKGQSNQNVHEASAPVHHALTEWLVGSDVIGESQDRCLLAGILKLYPV